MYVYTSYIYICIYKVLTIETESELVDENEAFFVLVATSDSLSNISTQDFLFFFLRTLMQLWQVVIYRSVKTYSVSFYPKEAN